MPDSAEVVLLSELSSPEIRERLPGIELVLIPVGAHEQHGPNLAVSTDTVSADALCRAAASRLGTRVAVAPPIPWGVSWHHLRFPGTIALRPDTLIALLDDIISSLFATGFSRFLVVNGHGGNQAAITTAIERLKAERQIPLLAAIFGYALIAEQARRLLPAAAIGHAGGDEASLVWAVAPHLAKPAAFAPPDLTGAQAASAELLRQYGGTLARTYDEVTRNGATGDATLASPEVGREILAGAADRLAEIVETLIEESNIQVGG